MEEEVAFMRLVTNVSSATTWASASSPAAWVTRWSSPARHPALGLLTVTSGAKFSSIYGMFDVDRCGTYPLARVKGVNVYDAYSGLQQFDLSIEKVMNGSLRGGQCSPPTWACSSTSPGTVSST